MHTYLEEEHGEYANSRRDAEGLQGGEGGERADPEGKDVREGRYRDRDSRVPHRYAKVLDESVGLSLSLRYVVEASKGLSCMTSMQMGWKGAQEMP